MSRSSLYGAVAWLVLAACGSDLGNDLGDGVSASTGLPCDIQAILIDHCDGCHGAKLAGGAPIHLRTYADLVATGSSGGTIAQRCLDRMMSTTARMPPPPASALTAVEISTFQAWIAQGAPSEDCADGTGDPFGGS
jgi:hypothetical protein